MDFSYWVKLPDKGWILKTETVPVIDGKIKIELPAGVVYKIFVEADNEQAHLSQL
jgi:hypothetical protein